jgi:hypothetical protein
MFKAALLCIGVLLSLITVAPSAADAQTRNNRTTLTFSQPIEVPGRILPAGTYVFQLADSLSDRHIVQISNADGSELITTVLAINNYRLTATDKTVVTFNEVTRGAPEAIRAWFYPGNNYGQEFVYPKRRAEELAIAVRAPVPALTVEPTNVEALRTAPLVAVTPERREAPIAEVIQTTPVPESQLARQLPRTASTMPLIAFLGFLSAVAGLSMMAFRKPVPAPVAPTR